MISYSYTTSIDMRLRSDSLQLSDFHGLIKDRKKISYSEKFSGSLSIVILGYDEGDDCLRLIESIYKNSGEVEFEVVFVDNGLDQSVVDRILDGAWSNFVYLKLTQNVGCSIGRNIGALESRGAFLVFLDSDGVIDSRALWEIHKHMLSRKLVALRGKVIPITNDDGVYVPSHYDLGDQALVSFIDAEGISCWKKDVFMRAGGFEGALAGGEGLILCYRMCEFYGIDRDQFMYIPDILLRHDFSFDAKNLKYKLRQREIVSRQRLMRYPFIEDFISYYSQYRSQSDPLPRDVALLANKLEDEIRVEYDQALESLQAERNENRHFEEPLFSVVIPCYNLGEYILNAVASIRSQTLREVEIIVVDDASTDVETRRMLRKLDSCVEVIFLDENNGVSHARNIGIQKARAQYVLCLDADDTIAAKYLEMAKNVFDSDRGVDLVSCHVSVSGETSWIWKPQDRFPLREALVSSPLPTATCFRKNAHERSGGYDTHLRGYEDWDHWLRIMKLGGEVRVLPHKLFYYYSRPDSKVKTSNGNSDKLFGRIIENHSELYDQHYKFALLCKHKQWLSTDMAFKALQNESVRVRQENEQLREENAHPFITGLTRLKKKFIP